MADEPQLFEYLTVMEHLRLTARLYRVRDVDARARDLLAELQLTGKEHALPAELSRGMKQKVAIACGLLHDPKALLFDEPLTGLDPLGIRHMKETIVARGRSGAAVIVSSHLLHLVEEICTRIVIIDHGVKVADATLAELKAHPELAAAGSSLEQIFLTATAGELVDGRRVPLPDGVLLQEPAAAPAAAAARAAVRHRAHRRPRSTCTSRSSPGAAGRRSAAGVSGACGDGRAAAVVRAASSCWPSPPSRGCGPGAASRSRSRARRCSSSSPRR